MKGNKTNHKGKSLADRFWAKVDKTNIDGCWVWTACKDKKGYGFLCIKKDGKWTGRGRATRVIWELTYGPIPDGLLICHRCNNPPCVRPDHLYLGTHSDNVQDAVRNRTHSSPRGEQHPKAKLTRVGAREIRNLYSSRVGICQNATVSQRKLAAQFGVSRWTIRACLSGITWKESKETIEKRIAKIEADDRYISGQENPATIEINAPLALIQLEMETQVATLKWVLKE